MEAVRLKLLVCFAIIFKISHSSQISNERLCADPKCQETISTAKALVRHVSTDPQMLSFTIGEQIFVKSKSAGTRQLLWGGEVNGKTGYFPKDRVRETRIYVSKPTHVVPTIPSKETDDESITEIDDTELDTDTREAEVDPTELDSEDADETAPSETEEPDPTEASEDEVDETEVAEDGAEEKEKVDTEVDPTEVDDTDTETGNMELKDPTETDIDTDTDENDEDTQDKTEVDETELDAGEEKDDTEEKISGNDEDGGASVEGAEKGGGFFGGLLGNIGGMLGIGTKDVEAEVDTEQDASEAKSDVKEDPEEEADPTEVDDAEDPSTTDPEDGTDPEQQPEELEDDPTERHEDLSKSEGEDAADEAEKDGKDSEEGEDAAVEDDVTEDSEGSVDVDEAKELNKMIMNTDEEPDDFEEDEDEAGEGTGSTKGHSEGQGHRNKPSMPQHEKPASSLDKHVLDKQVKSSNVSEDSAATKEAGQSDERDVEAAKSTEDPDDEAKDDKNVLPLNATGPIGETEDQRTIQASEVKTAKDLKGDSQVLGSGVSEPLGQLQPPVQEQETEKEIGKSQAQEVHDKEVEDKMAKVKSQTGEVHDKDVEDQMAKAMSQAQEVQDKKAVEDQVHEWQARQVHHAQAIADKQQALNLIPHGETSEGATDHMDHVPSQSDSSNAGGLQRDMAQLKAPADGIKIERRSEIPDVHINKKTPGNDEVQAKEHVSSHQSNSSLGTEGIKPTEQGIGSTTGQVLAASKTEPTNIIDSSKSGHESEGSSTGQILESSKTGQESEVPKKRKRTGKHENRTNKTRFRRFKHKATVGRSPYIRLKKINQFYIKQSGQGN